MTNFARVQIHKTKFPQNCNFYIDYNFKFQILAKSSYHLIGNNFRFAEKLATKLACYTAHKQRAGAQQMESSPSPDHTHTHRGEQEVEEANG